MYQTVFAHNATNSLFGWFYYFSGACGRGLR